LPHLRVLATAPEQTSRLNPEVPIPLRVRVKDNRDVGLLRLLLGLLDGKLFFLGEALLLLLFSFEMLDNRLEVALLQILRIEG
jgi:hypothetical protein